MLILVIDDSQTIRRLISRTLNEMGTLQIVEADSTEKALSILKFCIPDIIITDWHMPGMSGLELVKELRSRPHYKNTPIIMSTSESAGENVVAALHAGVSNYIIKPFKQQQLSEKIRPFIKAASTPSSMTMKAVSQSGTLGASELGNLLQFFIQSRKTGRCELQCANCVGEIYFVEGQIKGARYQLQKGVEAFCTCFTVPVKFYKFVEIAPEIAKDCAINNNSIELLLHAASLSDKHRVSTANPDFTESRL